VTERVEGRSEIPVRVQYESTFKSLFEERTEQLKRKCERDAFVHVVNSLRKSFPIWVVVTGRSGFGYHLVRYLGESPDGMRFLFNPREGTIESVVETPEDSLPIVDHVKDFWAEKREAIFGLLEKQPQVGESKEIIVPPNFFVFVFEGLETGPGYEEKPINMARVINAESFDKAAIKLMGSLWNRRQNYFWNFRVYGDGRWWQMEVFLDGIKERQIYGLNVGLASKFQVEKDLVGPPDLSWLV